MTAADHDEEAEMVATRAFGDTGITVSEIGLGTVSYTHLTLPTKRIV